MSRLFVRASSQYLEHAAAVVSAHPLTLACWCYLADNTNSQDLMMIGQSTASVNWRLNAGGNAVGDPIRAVIDQGAGQTIAATTTGYSLNTWHHACAVFTSDTSRSAYIDGGSKATATGSVVPSGCNRTAIGRLTSGSPGNYTDGQIAEAAIWNVALTDAEVAVLARGYSPLLVRPQSLVAYWPLLGNASPETSLKGGFSMTVTGATKADHPRVYCATSPLIVTPGSAASFDRKKSSRFFSFV